MSLLLLVLPILVILLFIVIFIYWMKRINRNEQKFLHLIDDDDIKQINDILDNKNHENKRIFERETLLYSKKYIRQYNYSLQKVTCIGHKVKFRCDDSNSYLEGIVTSISFDKVVIFVQFGCLSHSVKWCNILENMSIIK